MQTTVSELLRSQEDFDRELAWFQQVYMSTPEAPDDGTDDTDDQDQDDQEQPAESPTVKPAYDESRGRFTGC